MKSPQRGEVWLIDLGCDGWRQRRRSANWAFLDECARIV